MAQRPVFMPLNKAPWYQTCEVDFHWNSGFAMVQRRKNIAAIHEIWQKEHPGMKVLEASSKAPTELGLSLSPFYLMLGKYPVENVYQSTRVFANGGPYHQVLDMPAIKAKTWGKLKTSGDFLYYDWDGRKYPALPRGWFFAYLYMKALADHPQLLEDIQPYDGFTDIAFNPRTGAVCQAMVLAIALSLKKKGKLEEALSSTEAFRKIVYKVKPAAKPEEDAEEVEEAEAA